MLEILDLNSGSKWSETVKQFQDHDIYYFPEYADTFFHNGEGDPMLIYYESGRTRAINVVMRRDIASCGIFADQIEKRKFFDIATPYGYGGFLIEGEKGPEALAQMDSEYCKFALGNGIVSEFVRFHPQLGNHKGLESVYEIKEIGKTISMDLVSPDVIYSNILNKARNRIRKAEKSGIRVLSGRTAELYTAFKDIYDGTMDKKNANEYYYFDSGFYNSIREGLKDNALIFFAVLEDKIIAISIFLCCNGKMHVHLGGSLKEYIHLAPVVLLYYKAALWGYENGMRTLHLGGGVGAKEDSLYKFKSQFNVMSDNRFAVGRKIFDRDKYDFLMDLRKKSPAPLDPDFFPPYRA